MARIKGSAFYTKNGRFGKEYPWTSCINGFEPLEGAVVDITGWNSACSTGCLSAVGSR